MGNGRHKEVPLLGFGVWKMLGIISLRGLIFSNLGALCQLQHYCKLSCSSTYVLFNKSLSVLNMVTKRAKARAKCQVVRMYILYSWICTCINLLLVCTTVVLQGVWQDQEFCLWRPTQTCIHKQKNGNLHPLLNHRSGIQTHFQLYARKPTLH